ncbi:glycosyltransferase family 1 protein [Lasiosphaeria ovina]|uniref:Glycosyltransferase family 1 protein n=1 Tax=Lasiosphaeria ovina TaxID=92902 RepID=A0AAE0KIJ6_9PEZI|nr:glycosyltransferase family 1 protein [Lasiosphaeria ovina]
MDIITKPKPVILVLCTSSTAPGHVLPLCTITKHLVGRGYEVTFVGGVQHRALIEASGAAFFAVHDSISLAKGPFRQWGMERARFAEGLPRMRHDFATFFVGQVAGQFASTSAALLHLRRRYGSARDVLVINECMWFGYLPFKFGAPPPEGFFPDGDDGAQRAMPRSLGVNVTPLMLDSVDTPAMPLGLLPVPPPETASSSSPDLAAAVRERDALIRDLLYKYVVRESYDAFREQLRACGATAVPDEWMVNLSVTAHDTTLQLCDAALEYPRSDLPAHVRFAGSLPPRPPPPGGFALPAWWERDVLAPAAAASGATATAPKQPRRHVVVVSQGTLARDYSMLVAPTVAALAGREDVLLVVLLGKPGAELPPGILPPAAAAAANSHGNNGACPTTNGHGHSGEHTSKPGNHAAEQPHDNIRVADFIPYDAVLAHASAMVFNGGYGGFGHCVAHGVPMVAAGLTEDKCEVAARAEWAGVAVNLRTGRPSAAAVAAAVDRVLYGEAEAGGGVSRYAARARELVALVARGDPLGLVEQEVLALTA